LRGGVGSCATEKKFKGNLQKNEDRSSKKTGKKPKKKPVSVNQAWGGSTIDGGVTGGTGKGIRNLHGEGDGMCLGGLGGVCGSLQGPPHPSRGRRGQKIKLQRKGKHREQQHGRTSPAEVISWGVEGGQITGPKNKKKSKKEGKWRAKKGARAEHNHKPRCR